jgi:hypothetical protein
MDRETVGNGTDRRAFLGRAGVAAAGVAAFGAVPAIARAGAGGITPGDVEILVAAEIAEALAVTTYTNITRSAFFANLAEDDQGYIEAARQEEMSHYLLEQGASGKPSPFTTFYFPPNMFGDAQTTLNVLVSLEDAFIAAYLVGVRQFSHDDLRVTAARIMGIESDHRTLARVVAESVDPPNDNGYERTLGWTTIDQAIAALLPFADRDAAAKAGFDSSKPYTFEPFVPTLPSPLGEFHSFTG